MGVYSLRIVATDNVLRLINTFMMIMMIIMKMMIRNKIQRLRVVRVASLGHLCTPGLLLLLLLLLFLLLWRFEATHSGDHLAHHAAVH